MLNKIMFVFVLLVALVSTGVLGYRYYEENKVKVKDATIQSYIDSAFTDCTAKNSFTVIAGDGTSTTTAKGYVCVTPTPAK